MVLNNRFWVCAYTVASYTPLYTVVMPGPHMAQLKARDAVISH